MLSHCDTQFLVHFCWRQSRSKIERGRTS